MSYVYSKSRNLSCSMITIKNLECHV